MAALVSADWVQQHADAPDALLLDPRRPMRYLQGHLKNAVNVPLFQAFNAEGRLQPIDALARWLGTAGLDSERRPVVYDGYDGQSGAMLVWILEYLGCDNVHLLDVFYERWIADGREIFYKPAAPPLRQFQPHLNQAIQARPDEVLADPALKLIDFRSEDEYSGKTDHDGKPGHIPGAVNIAWKGLLGMKQDMMFNHERVQELLNGAGIGPGDQVVAYCRTGPRAALGYVVLRQLGYMARLLEGSYAEWVRRGLPIESGQSRTDGSTSMAVIQ